MLNDPNNLRCIILALGLESGFNSKASLNRIFKYFTGLTPKQHLDIKSQSVA
jgi:AraC-like DNA-binding protein